VVERYFTGNRAIDLPDLEFIFYFFAVFDLYKPRWFFTRKDIGGGEDRDRKLLRVPSRCTVVIGVRDDDAGNPGALLQLTKFRVVEQDWVDNENAGTRHDSS